MITQGEDIKKLSRYIEEEIEEQVGNFRQTITKLLLIILAGLAIISTWITLTVLFPEIMFMLMIAPTIYMLIKPLLPEERAFDSEGLSFLERVRYHLYDYRYSYLLAAFSLACAGGVIAMSFFVPYVYASTVIAIVATGGVNVVVNYLLPSQKIIDGIPTVNRRTAYIRLAAAIAVAAGLTALSLFVPYVLGATIAVTTILYGMIIFNKKLDKHFLNKKKLPQWAKYTAALLVLTVIGALVAVSLTTPLAPLATTAALFVLHTTTSGFLSVMLSSLAFLASGIAFGGLNKLVAKGLTYIGDSCSREDNKEEISPVKTESLDFMSDDESHESESNLTSQLRRGSPQGSAQQGSAQQGSGSTRFFAKAPRSSNDEDSCDEEFFSDPDTDTEKTACP